MLKKNAVNVFENNDICCYQGIIYMDAGCRDTNYEMLVFKNWRTKNGRMK